jgi:hypothetical protein
MLFAILIPMLISLLTLAAHFFRGGNLVMVLICCAAPWLMVLRRVWATRLLQVILLLGALEWVRTALEIATVRQETGMAWMRMAIILGSVAVWTLISGLLLFLCPTVPTREPQYHAQG